MLHYFLVEFISNFSSQAKNSAEETDKDDDVIQQILSTFEVISLLKFFFQVHFVSK